MNPRQSRKKLTTNDLTRYDDEDELMVSGQNEVRFHESKGQRQGNFQEIASKATKLPLLMNHKP